MQGSLTIRSRQAPQLFHAKYPRGRKLVCCVRDRRSNSDSSPEILTAFFYGRALAITINKRLSEAVIDVVSEISKATAERPQKIAEFQDEVMALARKEMSSSGFLPLRALSGSASSSSPSRGTAAAAPIDPQAAIDDLRAEIAYARASLNEIRAKQQASSGQN